MGLSLFMYLLLFTLGHKAALYRVPRVPHYNETILLVSVAKNFYTLTRQRSVDPCCDLCLCCDLEV